MVLITYGEPKLEKMNDPTASKMTLVKLEALIEIYFNPLRTGRFGYSLNENDAGKSAVYN